MKKALSLLLAMLMLTATVAACGTKPQADDVGSDGTTAPSAAGTTVSSGDASETTLAVETVPPELRDDLPDVNYNGETFTILIRKDTAYEVLSEGLSGDLVSDAVYERNLTVEDRFGVNIEVVTANGIWDKRSSFINRVSNSILSGDHEFDLVMTHNTYLCTMPAQGLAYDMKKLDALDFSKKWWCEQYMTNAAINDAVYTATGDIAVTVYEYLEAVFFNKKLAEENGITGLYETVQAGDWTWDKMMGYVLQVGGDLNGDGIYDSSDLYGLSIDNANCRHATTIWETNITVVGEDGRRKINIPNEKYIDTYDRLYSAIYEHDQVFYDASNYSDTKMFVGDQVLFMTDCLGEAAYMKDMSSEYGIIPFPKYDENQADYLSCMKAGVTSIMVASNIEEPDMVGTLIEALCMYGCTDITPAYYETTLKLKYLSDETAMSMLDLIRDKLAFDFAMSYNMVFSDLYSIVGNNMNKGVSSITSIVKGKADVWQKLMEQLYEDYEKLDD